MATDLDIEEIKNLTNKIFGQNKTISSNCKNQRSEDLYYVEEAKSVMPDAFKHVTIPQNPRLGKNSYGSPHNDSYCSESADTAGPDSDKVLVIRQRNPYGYTPCMVSNKFNQMIGVSFDWQKLSFYLVVYSKDCELISSTRLELKTSGTFGGGYFFMNEDEYTIIGTTNTLKCFDTRLVTTESGDHKNGNALTAVWESDDLLQAFKHDDGKPILDSSNALYSAMPVWTEEKLNLFWVLFAGKYSLAGGKYSQPAAMGIVEIVDGQTIPIDIQVFEKEWNNNTFSVDETGAYFVTNVVGGVIEKSAKSYGNLRKVTYDASKKKIVEGFTAQYLSCEYLKEGQKNVGSGTTPTLIDTSEGRQLVGITDNADPQLNVVLYDRMTGEEVSRTPVFAPMRSADEASLIGVEDAVFVENNYGHELTYPASQLTPIEPGMARINLSSADGSCGSNGVVAETSWNDDHTSFLAMSMLARRTGIIYAHTADWSGDLSATQGAMYYVSAIDAYTGRTIWRVPLGRGVEFCHDYGGVYFNRDGSLYIGTANYFISVQNYEE